MKTRILCLLFGILLCFKSKAQDLYFPPASGTWQTVSPTDLAWCNEPLDSLRAYLSEHNTKSFIILKDGKIAAEWYYDTFTADSLWYWASAGKSLMSTLVGIAQSEEVLKITDTTANYLGNGWTSLTQLEEDKISIWNQLSMTTGLDETEFDCTDPACLQKIADPDTRWAYHNAPYSLLREVLESASGQSINVYFKQKIGDKIGMKGAYIRTGYNNLFFSTARDMAKFGLLTLAKGNWNGTEVLEDKDYYTQMISPSQSLNKAYGLLWWLNGQETFMLPTLRTVFNGYLIPTAPADMFAALGKNDQKIYVVPSQNLVVIRQGNAAGLGQLALSDFDNIIWDYLSRVQCVPTALEDDLFPHFQLFPNPTNSKISVTANMPIRQLEAFNLQGKLVRLIENSSEMDLQDLPKGIYCLKITFQNGQTVTKRILKKQL